MGQLGSHLRTRRYFPNDLEQAIRLAGCGKTVWTARAGRDSVVFERRR
jgi:hypothetical protein